MKVDSLVDRHEPSSLTLSSAGCSILILSNDTPIGATSRHSPEADRALQALLLPLKGVQVSENESLVLSHSVDS